MIGYEFCPSKRADTSAEAWQSLSSVAMCLEHIVYKETRRPLAEIVSAFIFHLVLLD